MGKAITAAIIAIALAIAPASAQIVDGAHLRHVCLTKAIGEQASCAGFISGVVDATMRQRQFCIPDTVPPEEVIRRVTDYIGRNRLQIGSLPGEQQVTLGLKAIWPCTNGPQVAAASSKPPWVLAGCYFGAVRVPC
jgi:Rap1a immunity proteins